MKKIIMISGLILACIAEANCQRIVFYSRNPAAIHTRVMITPQIDPLNRFLSREDLNELKENLEKIMFHGLEGYRMEEIIQIKNSIDNVLSEQTNGLTNLNNFIYERFHKDIMYNRFSMLNKCILETFDRKSGIYVEAYNKLAQIGKDMSPYLPPAVIDRFGNIIPISHYSL